MPIFRCLFLLPGCSTAGLCDSKRLWSSVDVFERGAKYSCWGWGSSWEPCEQVALVVRCNLVVIECTAYLKLGFLVFSWWCPLVPTYWVLLPSLSKTFLVLYLPWLKTYVLEHHVASVVSRDKQCKDCVLTISFKIRSCGRVLVVLDMEVWKASWSEGRDSPCDTTKGPFHVHFNSQQMKLSLPCDLRNFGAGGRWTQCLKLKVWIFAYCLCSPSEKLSVIVAVIPPDEGCRF